MRTMRAARNTGGWPPLDVRLVRPGGPSPNAFFQNLPLPLEPLSLREKSRARQRALLRGGRFTVR